MEFFNDCVRLFDMTFNAALGLDIFKLFTAYFVGLGIVGLWRVAYKSTF